MKVFAFYKNINIFALIQKDIKTIFMMITNTEIENVFRLMMNMKYMNFAKSKPMN